MTLHPIYETTKQSLPTRHERMKTEMSESDRKTWRWRLIFAMVGLGAVFDCQHFLVALLFFFICRGVALNAALALWSDEPAEDDQAEELAALKLENLRLLKLLSPPLPRPKPGGDGMKKPELRTTYDN